jgi:DNA replication ATP-dependent helicase Dna2
LENESSEIIVSGQDLNTMIILNPDMLLSVTTVANSFDCTRKSILQSKIKSTFEGNPAPLISGRILHECFQASLYENNFEYSWISQKLRELIGYSIEDLCVLGRDEKEMYDDLAPSIPFIQQWKTDNMIATPSYKGIQKIISKVRVIPISTASNKWKLDTVLEIEERIWSSKYGINGNIDATLKMKSGDICKIVPLELKTGKGGQNASHRSQMIMYTFLLSDKYNEPVVEGLLSYLNKNGSQFIPSRQDEKVAILQQRNKLCGYIEIPDLPPVIKNENNCRRCFVSESCLTYHKAVESGTTESAGVGTLFDTLTSHLTEKDVEFIAKWEKVISSEELKSPKSSNKDIWSVVPEVRIQNGNCIADLIIAENSGTVMIGNERNFIYKLKPRNVTIKAISSSHFSDGDPIIVTSSCSPFSPVALGVIQLINTTTVVICIDKALDESYQLGSSEAEIFTIDLQHFNGGMGLVRNNVLQLFKSSQNDQEKRRKRLIVQLDAPLFDTIIDNENVDKSLLNESQKACIYRILAGNYYT